MLDTLKSKLKQDMPTNPSHITVLGFDYGRKRIGVAVGQNLTSTATPLTTFNNVVGQPDWEGISQLINKWKPNALIVGMPYSMDGGENKTTQAAHVFRRHLEKRYTLPVHIIDERLSSVEAELRLSTQDSSKRTKRNKASIDKLAAQIIVETWLRQ